MTVELGWQLALALGFFVALGAGVALWAGLPVVRAVPWAALRAGLQLLVVSLVVGFALRDAATAFAFVALMFTIGVLTTARRAELRSATALAAAALTMLAGALPVLLIVFVTGSAPLDGAAIVPIGGIIVGNMMSLHTLVTRRAFADLRGATGQFEAYLALGLPRSFAIREIVTPNLHEGLIPALDQTRTVGLVTLPGAYIGVLLGGGSPWTAAAAQVLVLVGINAGQVCAAVCARWLMGRSLLLPTDLRLTLRP